MLQVSEHVNNDEERLGGIIPVTWHPDTKLQINLTETICRIFVVGPQPKGSAFFVRGPASRFSSGY
jgi:hypothetical protein